MQIMRPEIGGDPIAIDGFRLLWLHGDCWLAERLARAREQSSTTGIGEESIVADTHEPFG